MSTALKQLRESKSTQHPQFPVGSRVHAKLNPSTQITGEVIKSTPGMLKVNTDAGGGTFMTWDVRVPLAGGNRNFRDTWEVTLLGTQRGSTDPDAHALEVIDLINSTSIAGKSDKLSRDTLGVSSLRVLYERDGEQVNLTVQLNARGRDKVIVGWEGSMRSPEQAQRAVRLYKEVVELATSIESL